MKAAAYLINRLPSSVLGYTTPYEKFYNKKPALNQFQKKKTARHHLKVLGYLYFAKVVHELDKLKPRLRKAIHMGYSETKKGYILYDLIDKIFSVNSDVIFLKGTFPFKDTDTSFTIFISYI